MSYRKLVLAIILICFFSPNHIFAEELPHYFLEGIVQETEPIKQKEALARYMNATGTCMKAGRYQRSFERSITKELVLEGKSTTLIFDPWVRVGEKIIYYDFCGQREISQHEMDIVIEDIVQQYKIARDIGYENFSKLYTLAIKAKAGHLNKSPQEIRELLETVDPNTDDILYRELLKLPEPMTRADFVSKEVHIGYLPEGILGVTWLNTEVLWISPAARMLDYLIGKPAILLHEMVHSNRNLQSYPLSNAMDMELIASWPEMLFSEDHVSLMGHGYMRDIREIVNIYFGFDFDQARDEIVMFDHYGTLRINAQKFNEYALKLLPVKLELRKALLGAFAEYYSDPIYWSSMHEKLQDKKGVFSIYMALHYDPTICGGHADCMQFLLANHSQIMLWASEAFKASGGSVNNENTNTLISPISQRTLALLENRFGVDQKELLRLAEKYNISERSIAGMSTVELFEILVGILEQEQANVVRKGVK